MALTTDDYRLKHRIYNSYYQEWYHNTWYFKDSASLGSSSDLLSSFNFSVLPSIQTFLVNTCNASQLSVENLGDLDDFSEDLSVPFAGAVASGEMMPKWDVFAFRIARGSRVNKRHGRKVFGPLVETQQSGQFPLSGTLTALNAAAVVFGNSFGVLGTYQVCVPHSIKIIDPDYKLGYYYVLDELIVADEVMFARISTQTSHK